MPSRYVGWACALALIVSALPVLAAQNFGYVCASDRYTSVPVGTQQQEFRSQILASPPTNDSVDVIFEAHVPPSWFAQWCHTLTGVCYFGNQRIGLVSGALDSLRIDIMPFGSPTPAVGYVDMTIRSAVDPLDVEHCTYTLFYGLPVPNVRYQLDCSDNTRYVDPASQSTEFFSPFRSSWSGQDSLLIEMTPSVPGTWFAQFCQVSTGTCYLDHGKLPLPPFARDTLRVDFYEFGNGGAGSADLRVHSVANPSLTQYCHYLVFAGSYPEEVPEVVDAGSARRLWAQPNPFRQSTALRMISPRTGSGTLSLFAADGRLVRTFPVNLPSGAAQVEWDGRDQGGAPVPSGIYFCRLHTAEGDMRALLVRAR